MQNVLNEAIRKPKNIKGETINELKLIQNYRKKRSAVCTNHQKLTIRKAILKNKLLKNFYKARAILYSLKRTEFRQY